MMRYYSSECPVLSATDGVSYEIAVCGCHFHCKNCQNPELQSFSAGVELTPEVRIRLLSNIYEYYKDGKIDNIDIIGGEPLDQGHEEFIDLLKSIRTNFPDIGIWIYTGYEIKDISDDILELSDYIKCGQYIEELRSNDGFKSEYGPTLITSNQYIIKCKDELLRRSTSC